MRWTLGKRRVRMRTTSRTAAPLGELITPIGWEEEAAVFARSIKEAFGFETFFQLLEGELQRALPHQVDFLDVNLIFAALFVDADGAAHGDLQTVLGAELDAALLLLEVNAADLGAGRPSG